MSFTRYLVVPLQVVVCTASPELSTPSAEPVSARAQSAGGSGHASASALRLRLRQRLRDWVMQG